MSQIFGLGTTRGRTFHFSENPGICASQVLSEPHGDCAMTSPVSSYKTSKCIKASKNERLRTLINSWYHLISLL